MTLFQRTPNLCLPMRQRKLTKEEQAKNKEEYPQIFKDRMQTFAGFAYDFQDKNAYDDDDEERRRNFEDLWDKGTCRGDPCSYHLANPCQVDSISGSQRT